MKPNWSSYILPAWDNNDAVMKQGHAQLIEDSIRPNIIPLNIKTYIFFLLI